MAATLAPMSKRREEDWSSYLRRLASRGELAKIHEDEQVLHDLYVSGEITMDEVYLVVSRQMTVEEVVGETSILSYRCILCRDLGCEFCPGVES